MVAVQVLNKMRWFASERRSLRHSDVCMYTCKYYYPFLLHVDYIDDNLNSYTKEDEWGVLAQALFAHRIKTAASEGSPPLF